MSVEKFGPQFFWGVGDNADTKFSFADDEPWFETACICSCLSGGYSCDACKANVGHSLTLESGWTYLFWIAPFVIAV